MKRLWVAIFLLSLFIVAGCDPDKRIVFHKPVNEVYYKSLRFGLDAKSWQVVDRVENKYMKYDLPWRLGVLKVSTESIRLRLVPSGESTIVNIDINHDAFNYPTYWNPEETLKEYVEYVEKD